MSSPLLLYGTLMCILPFQSLASEVYEVTATSLPENTGTSETIISRQDIETYQETFLRDALPYAPSVLLNSNGTLGRKVDFSIRGARSSQNLVLFNGIYVNDPASGGSADLADFLNADLERIEVLPGPQNLAYGPGALGGVIQLIPKKGHGKPSLKFHGEGGSFGTKYGTLTAQGEKGPLQFSATMAGFGRGPSSFTNQVHGNRQSDHYRNGTFSSRVGYALTDNWEIEGILRYSEGKVQFDSPQFIPEKNICLPFKADNFSNNKTLLASLENRWGSENVDYSFKLFYSRLLRKTDMPKFHNTSLGEHPFFNAQSTFKLNKQQSLLMGLDGGQERAKGKSLHKRNHGGIFLIHTYQPFQSTVLKAGLRDDQYQSLGNRITYSIGADQKITSSTTLRASYGTNFKPPILSDLFEKNLPWQIPNPHLKPEESQSVEAGLDQTFWKQKAKVSLTGFMNWIKKITLSRKLPNGKWQRYNGELRKTRGLELAFSLTPRKDIEIKSAFTLTHSRDYPHHKKSPLVPTFKGAGGIHWQALPKLSFFVQGYGVSTQKDSISKKKISPYGIIHIGGAYDLNRYASLFGRIENLTNKHYEEVFGYGNRGRSVYIGIEAKT